MKTQKSSKPILIVALITVDFSNSFSNKFSFNVLNANTLTLRFWMLCTRIKGSFVNYAKHSNFEGLLLKFKIDCKSVVIDFGGSNPPSPTSSQNRLKHMFRAFF